MYIDLQHDKVSLIKEIAVNGEIIPHVIAMETGPHGYVEKYKTVIDYDGTEYFVMANSEDEIETEIICGDVKIIWKGEV